MRDIIKLQPPLSQQNSITRWGDIILSLEQIVNGNKKIKYIDLKGKKYAETAQRIVAFRAACPGGCIVPEIVQLNDDCDEVVFKATVFDEEGKVIAVGHAHERAADSYINKLSMIENCETSAIGRALGLCGFGIASGGLASYDEMVKSGAANAKPVASDECAVMKEKLNALTASLVSSGVEKKTISAKIKEIAGIVNYNKITDVAVLDKILKTLEELK